MLVVLFWDDQIVFSSHSDFAGMCVAAATLLEYLLAGQKRWNKQASYSAISQRCSGREEPRSGAKT
jgi:hypothetical protein